MFNTQLDLVAIGDLATDAFIRLKDAHVNCKVNSSECELCMKFGDKVPFESVHITVAVGNSPNATVSASRLGLSTALISHIGDDQNGRDDLEQLTREGISTKLITVDAGKTTNFHYVLWYEVDRTILIHHESFNYHLPKEFLGGTPPKWLYLSSLGGTSYKYHLEIVDYLKKHPEVRLAFQPGTYQMKLGANQLRDIYKRTEVFVCNVEESQRILGLEEKGSANIDDTKALLKAIHALGPKLTLITDGPKGAYMFDGDRYYYMPIYPDPKDPLERTGCGDAFASTFVSALILGHTPLEALTWGPINPMSVVQYIGAQEGLLHRDKIESLLAQAKADYKPREI
jgi:ribokinase